MKFEKVQANLHRLANDIRLGAAHTQYVACTLLDTSEGDVKCCALGAAWLGAHGADNAAVVAFKQQLNFADLGAPDVVEEYGLTNIYLQSPRLIGGSFTQAGRLTFYHPFNAWITFWNDRYALDFLPLWEGKGDIRILLADALDKIADEELFWSAEGVRALHATETPL